MFPEANLIYHHEKAEVHDQLIVDIPAKDVETKREDWNKESSQIK